MFWKLLACLFLGAVAGWFVGYRIGYQNCKKDISKKMDAVTKNLKNFSDALKKVAEESQCRINSKNTTDNGEWEHPPEG